MPPARAGTEAPRRSAPCAARRAPRARGDRRPEHRNRAGYGRGAHHAETPRYRECRPTDEEITRSRPRRLRSAEGNAANTAEAAEGMSRPDTARHQPPAARGRARPECSQPQAAGARRRGRRRARTSPPRSRSRRSSAPCSGTAPAREREPNGHERMQPGTVHGAGRRMEPEAEEKAVERAGKTRVAAHDPHACSRDPQGGAELRGSNGKRHPA